ncbi:methylated-DNA--[protein]-cysteine S-methyltransferase [Schauerella aestuarii]|uniref:methylated-DNA--[protein]-cysteine S-methyltransferase n=1 Tax=Schauerella aestuarii TaxID=2511204 RepID=UPI001371B991|nr:methylated-DNA--[protein]-cysteine S-methyltransferase [Achromobacter aestuarii]MYZ44401.1 methylated-DNA--[protein]-cysteine S-methyltransferase [Achromobacter aestuarii]
MHLFHHVLASPIGNIAITTDAADVAHAVTLQERDADLPKLLTRLYGVHTLQRAASSGLAVQALARYFEGERAALAEIAVAQPGNALQRQVWSALRNIPVGTVTHYGALAKRLSITDRGAAWKIGQANAANPIAIVVPCHRVIGKNGMLTGFAWGIDRKRWLLLHEGADLSDGASLLLPGF